MTKTDLRTANEIMKQLGGLGRLTVMLGAHTFTGDETSLTFKVKARALNGIKAVKVTLEPSDTYKVEFWSIRNHTVKLITELEGVYATDLVARCETVTGLAFRL